MTRRPKQEHLRRQARVPSVRFDPLAQREDAAEGGGIKLEAAPDDYRTPEMVAAVKEAIAARIALARTVPTTPAGLAALTTFIREKSVECSEFYFAADDPDEQLLFVASLDAAARGMAGLKPWDGIADAQAVDPVFAVIKHSERLWAEWTSVSITEPKQLRSPDYAAWDKRNTAAADAYNDAFDALLATKPATRAGAAALIAHCLSEKSRFSAGTESGGVAKTLLRTLEKAMPTLA